MTWTLYSQQSGLLRRLEVKRLLLIYGPSGKVPRDGDWNIRDRGPLPNDPRLIAEFATPDPDGYGVGKDACAKGP